MKLGFSPKIEHLDRYVAAKDYEKALAAVASELEKNPRRFNMLLRQAELLGLAGNRDQAIRVYRKLAEKYAHDGFYAKAIALYKKVLKLDSGLEDVNKELTRLIAEERESKRPLEERLRVQAGAEGPDSDLERQQEVKELRASRLFVSFDDQALEEILSSTSLRSYGEGDIIVTEGQLGSSLFLIVSGEVKVFTLGERGEHLLLAELGPGDFFGEVSLLTGKPRTATITAKTQVAAIELQKADVDRISIANPSVPKVLSEFYERRAQDTVEAVIRRMRGNA